MGEQTPFQILPMDEEPKTKYTKKSKYDAVLSAFIEKGIKLARITMVNEKTGEKYTGEYLSRQLQSRIVDREIENVKGRMINGEAYLQRTDIE